MDNKYDVQLQARVIGTRTDEDVSGTITIQNVVAQSAAQALIRVEEALTRALIMGGLEVA